MSIPPDFHHVDFDTFDESIATFIAHHPTELGINPSNWVNGCGNYNRIYVREDNGIVHGGDAEFAKTVINSLMIQLREVNLPDQWSVILDELARLVNDDGICPIYYGREAISSGYDTTRTVGLLRNSPTLAPLINAIYGEESATVTTLWLLGNHSGIHEWHRDKFPVEGYRCLITIGSDNKVMFFRNMNTGAQFGVGLFHGSHVSLSAFGAGVRGSARNGGDSPVRHCVMTVGNEQSWLMANQYNFFNP